MTHAVRNISKWILPLVGFVLILARMAPIAGAYRPDSATRSTSIRDAEKRLIEAAVDESRQIGQPNSFSDVKNDIASAQAAAGDVNAALSTIAGIKNKNLKNLAYVSVACVLAEQGKLEESKAVHAKIAGAESPNIFVESTIARVMVRQGNISGATAIAEAYGNNPTRDDIYEVIAQEQSASVIISATNETIAMIRNPMNKTRAFCRLAAAQIKANDLVSARKNIAEARNEMAKIAPVDDKSRVAGWVAYALACSNSLSEAQSIIDPMMKVSFRDNGYEMIACGLAESVRFEQARRIAAEISDGDIQAEAFGAVARAQTAGKDFGGANVSATQISSAIKRAEVLAEIADAEREMGNTAGFLGELNAASDALMASPLFDPLVCAKVAALQVFAGDTGEAFRTIRKSSKTAEERCRAFAWTVRELVGGGQAID